MNTRDSSVEFFRCALMLGICLFHSLGQGPSNIPVVSRLLHVCVPGFVFISGYYGITLKWKKVLKLYGIALYAMLMANLFLQLCFGDRFSVMGVFDDFKRCWFLHAYVVLMLFAPLMNAAIESGKRMGSIWQISLPLLVLIFGWGFLIEVPVVGKWIPVPIGLQSHSFLALMGGYLCGRMYAIIQGGGGISETICGDRLWR